MTWPVSTVDLRILDPTEWRRAIEDEFEMLAPRSTFLLVAEHDPAAILRASRQVCGDGFAWAPIEEGPELWRYAIETRDVAAQRSELPGSPS